MPHGQQAAVLKNESRFSAVKQGLGSVYSLLSWGASSSLKVGYSAYQYTKGILRYEQQQVQCEETKAKQELSSAEYALAETISHTLKEIAVSVILSSGASWPTIAYVTWGMLPKNTVIKLGTAVFGSHFPTVIDVQHIAGNTLTVMNGFFPTSWLQLGCKKGMDRAVNFIGSEQLLRIYQDYHMGERIWLWTGVAVNAQRDLKIVAPEVIQTEVLEYRHQDVVGTVTDTRHCRSKWLFWQECRVKERKIMEHNLSTHAIRNAILRSREDGELLEPVSYSEDTEVRNYSASYEDGHLVREVNVPHLPKPVNPERTDVSAFIFEHAVTLIDKVHPLILLLVVQRLYSQRSMAASIGIISFWHSTQFVALAKDIEKKAPEDFLRSLTSTFIHGVANVISDANQGLIKKLNLQSMSSDYQAAVLNLRQYENENDKRPARLDAASVSINSAIAKLVLNQDIFRDATHEDIFALLEVSYQMSAVMIYVLYKKAIGNNDMGEFKNMKDYMQHYKQFSDLAVDKIIASKGFSECEKLRKRDSDLIWLTYLLSAIPQALEKNFESHLWRQIEGEFKLNSKDLQKGVKSVAEHLNPDQPTETSSRFKSSCNEAETMVKEDNSRIWNKMANENKLKFCELILKCSKDCEKLPGQLLLETVRSYLDASCVNDFAHTFFNSLYKDHSERLQTFTRQYNEHIDKAEHFYLEIYNKYISLGIKPSFDLMSNSMKMMENEKPLSEILESIESKFTSSHKLEL